MKQITYTSKKPGNVIIKNELNQYTICSKRLEPKSLNQDEKRSLVTAKL